MKNLFENDIIYKKMYRSNGHLPSFTVVLVLWHFQLLLSEEHLHICDLFFNVRFEDLQGS